jgi:hypothetical protein
VTWDPYPPLPIGALRDLLGITRALYRTTQLDDPRDARRLHALEDIGRTLRAVLRAAHARPGTIDHLNAWGAAERATRALGALVGESTPLAPVIAATARRVSRPGSMG